ncbi:hypothetical protein SNE40_015094 [Patella caerulea]|uniref:TNFR-Cys domain-containing protein n=1 Tax=Patella caerulea TaxID=87958 RepID=A0AAN8PUM4_PATCE
MRNTHGLCYATLLSVIVIFVCLLPYICASSNILKKLLDGRDYYVTDKGIMCLMCPAGTFVSSDCETNLTRSHCESCRPGTFSSSMNKARSCEDCKPCGLGQEKIKNCSTKSDTVCVCPDNMVEVLNSDESGTHCELLPKTDNLRPTVIPFLPCPDDQYRDDNGNCRPCPSTLQPHVYYNVTFVDKPVTNKVDVTDKKNQEEVWYKAKNGLTCRKCPKGHFVLIDCKVNSTVGQCQECQKETYYPRMSKYASCKACKHCGIGQKIKEQCTTISDTVCVCRDNLVEIQNIGGSGSYCVPKTDTSVNPQQSSSTTVPQRPECLSGMYRDMSKNNDCFPCSNCSNVIHPCNGTHDTICASSQNTNESDNSNQGLIIGITVAAVVIVAIVGILAAAIRYYINKQKGRGLCKDEKWYKVLYSAIINTNIEETAN